METILTIKDDRGTVIIKAKIWVGSFGQTDQSGNLFRYDLFIEHIPPKKRNSVVNPNIATEDEKNRAKLELWNKLKP